jgi:ribonuclease HI
MTSKAIYTVHIDGASRGNPGPSGAGVVIETPDGEKIERAEYLGDRTNNQAEYEALIVALEELSRLGARSVRFLSDSELLVKQMRAEYRIKNQGLLPLFGRALSLLSELEHYEFELIRRTRNRRADQLANFAVDRDKSMKETGTS